MAQKQRTRSVKIGITPNAFTTIFRKFRGIKQDYDFSELSELRQVLSNEKAKILYTIKHQHPESIYHLAKLLGRDFKSVSQDVKVLEKFHFIELRKESKGNREKLMPILAIDSLHVIFDV